LVRTIVKDIEVKLIIIMRKVLMKIIFSRFFPKWITLKIIYKWNSSKSRHLVKTIVEVTR